MATGRSKENWRHTSTMLAMIANVNRSRGRAFTPDDFDPHKRGHKQVATKEDISFMKELFTSKLGRSSK